MVHLENNTENQNVILLNFMMTLQFIGMLGIYGSMTYKNSSN